MHYKQTNKTTELRKKAHTNIAIVQCNEWMNESNETNEKETRGQYNGFWCVWLCKMCIKGQRIYWKELKIEHNILNTQQLCGVCICIFVVYLVSIATYRDTKLYCFSITSALHFSKKDCKQNKEPFLIFLCLFQQFVFWLVLNWISNTYCHWHSDQPAASQMYFGRHFCNDLFFFIFAIFLCYCYQLL